MPHLADLPTAEFGRYITFSEIARTSEVQIETVVVWHRLMRAMGYEIGEKIKGAWNFDTQEFYIFSVAGTLSRAGYPIGTEVLRQIILACEPRTRPEKPLFLKTPGTFAIVAVDAPSLWDTMARMLDRAERNAA